MSLQTLPEDDKQVVFACLRAAAEGPFFPDWEFATLFGLDRDEVARIVADLPHVDDSETSVALAINNAMANLLGYPHGDVDAWSRFISVPESEVRRVFDRWRASRPTAAGSEAHVRDRMRPDLSGLVPTTKHDAEKVEALVALGYPAVAAIVPELLVWLKDINWPVARALSPFLARIGPPLAPHIRDPLQGDDEVWKYNLIAFVVADSTPLTEALRSELVRIAVSPSRGERREEVDQVAREALAKHGYHQTEPLPDPLPRLEHAPENALSDVDEVARFYDSCSELMRELLDALSAAPDCPRPFGVVEDGLGWPRRRIASMLGGVSRLRHREFQGRRPYRLADEMRSGSGRWEIWADGAQAAAIREARTG